MFTLERDNHYSFNNTEATESWSLEHQHLFLECFLTMNDMMRKQDSVPDVKGAEGQWAPSAHLVLMGKCVGSRDGLPVRVCTPVGKT